MLGSLVHWHSRRYILCPTTSTIICQAFSCTTFDIDGEESRDFMSADFAVRCGSQRHTFLLCFASIQIAIQPVGVPCLLGVLLWRKRESLSTRKTQFGGTGRAGLQDRQKHFKLLEFLFAVCECKALNCFSFNITPLVLNLIPLWDG